MSNHADLEAQLNALTARIIELEARDEKKERQIRELCGGRTRMRRQITALRHKNTELRAALKLDPKTQALTEVAFIDALDRAINRPSPMPEDMDPHGKGTLLLYVDIRDFKHFNARFLQRGGDEALRHVVRILLEKVRIDDAVGQRVGRTGGDEFTALFEHITEHEAHALAGRLNEAFRIETLMLKPRKKKIAVACHVECHIGAVWWPQQIKPASRQIINTGDDLMWDSKDNRDAPFAWRTITA